MVAPDRLRHDNDVRVPVAEEERLVLQNAANAFSVVSVVSNRSIFSMVCLVLCVSVDVSQALV